MRALSLVALLLVAAAPADMNDLRDLRVGVPASALPAEGYAAFHCTASATTLPGWEAFAKCPADATGLHAVGFGYDGGDTMVAGHPVLLTALFGDDGRLAALRIDTDNAARLFLRKKAFLLGLQARSRYGDDGWSCESGKPGDTAAPVGGVFVDESCRKTMPGRTVEVDRVLLRHPGTDLKAFVGETHVVITAAP
jgi:hypothetical protein